MPQSLSKVGLHLIFSTKNRQPIIDHEVDQQMEKYISAILKSLGCPVATIKCMPDHVHILLILSRSVTIAKVVEEVKKRSSKWIKTKDMRFESFSWQRGYGIFAVSESNIQTVREYINNQEERHKQISFQEEFIRFLKKHNLDYDERYVFD